MRANKLQQIADWTRKHSERKINPLSTQLTTDLLLELEQLVEDTIPQEIKALYSVYNGEEGEDGGLLLGHQFLSVAEIIKVLQFSKDLVKPLEREVLDPERSQRALSRLVELFRSSIPNQKRFGLFKKKWVAATFECGPGNYSGLKVSYPDGTIADAILKNVYADEVFQLIGQLHSWEKATYNWDFLTFTLPFEGGFTVERRDYHWDEELPLTSCPEDAIRLKYFHLKWIPLFSDYGGNYIGVDLDPGPMGKRGQVIVFGRDEEALFVVADSFDVFLDLLIEQIESEVNIFNKNLHLHELLRKWVAC